MKSKKAVYISIISIAVFCLLLLVAGLLIFYFVSPMIRETPQNLEVLVIEDDYYLVTDYNSQYNYRFVIEQKIDGEYITVSDIIETTNSTNLSANNSFILSAGSEFRFKVAYSSENGQNGNFSEVLEWKVTVVLDKVVPVFDNNVLSWNSVLNATSYSFLLICPDGEIKTIDNIYDTSFNFSGYDAGDYKVYVIANGGENFTSSISDIFSFTVV